MILMIPVFVGAGLYYYNVKVIEEEVTAANKLVMNQLKQSIDQRLHTVKMFTLQLESDDNLRGIMNTKRDFDKYYHYSLINLTNNFLAYTVANDMIDNFFVYFRNTGSILTPYGHSTLEGMTDNAFYGATWYFPDWVRSLKKEYREEIRPIYVENTKKISSIVYMQSLPFIRKIEHKANVFIKLNNDYFVDIINNMGEFNEWQASVAIMDEQDNILYAYGAMDFTHDVLSHIQEDGEGRIHENNQEDYYTYTVSSDETNWRYFIVIPASTFKKPIIGGHVIALLSLLVIIIMSIVAIVLIKKKRYDPLLSTIELLREDSATPFGSMDNAFESLKSYAIETKEKQEKLEKNVLQNQDYMQKYFLIRLITQAFRDKEEYIRLMDFYGVKLPGTYSNVVIFYMHTDDNVTGNAHDMFLAFMEQSKNDFMDTFKDHRGNSEIYPIYFNGMIVALVNYSEDVYRNNGFRRWLETFSKDIVDLDIHIAVSKRKVDIENIHKAYEEALQALEQNIVFGKKGIIHYDGHQEHKRSHEIKYYQYEANFVRMLENGEYGKAKNIINNLFNLVLKNQNPKINVVKCRMFGIINILMNSIDKDGLNSEMISFEEVYEKLTNFQTIEALREAIIDLLTLIEVDVKKNHSGQVKHIMSEIDVYIQKHYMQQELSVSQLANHFHMDIYELSRKYKKLTGTNLSDAIHLVRLGKAKTALNQSNETIKEIAVKYGYLNSDVFIRVFKRYEGITPGKYRKNSQY